MSRIRLTNRTRKGAEFADFPGTVNQPDRKDPKWDQYHTFEHTVNHELPDMRTEWKDNPRDEIGFGVPKVAHIWATAQKAVKLATLFLGDKCNDKVIEAQARDFMRLGSRRIEFALKRFATTEELYKAEEEVETEEVEAADEEVTEEAPVETAEMNEIQKMGEDKKEEPKKEEAPVVEEKKEASKAVKADASVQIQKPVVKAEDEVVEEEETTEEAECKAEDTEEIVDEDEEITADVEEDENEINMTPADEDVELTDEEEKTLSSVFADDDADEDDSEETVVEASKKKVGVKKLGGQPKVASKKSDDISSVWSDAPDVSHIFN